MKRISLVNLCERDKNWVLLPLHYSNKLIVSFLFSIRLSVSFSAMEVCPSIVDTGSFAQLTTIAEIFSLFVAETPVGRALLWQTLHGGASMSDSDRSVDPTVHGPGSVPGLQLHQPQRHRVGNILTHTFLDNRWRFLVISSLGLSFKSRKMKKFFSLNKLYNWVWISVKTLVMPTLQILHFSVWRIQQYT